MDKKKLRSEIMEKKSVLTDSQILDASARLAQRVYSHPAYQSAKSIYCYLAFNQEVQTLPILMQAQRDGKRVAVPKIYGREMRFLWLDDLAAVAPSSYGIPEPIADEPIADDDEALIIMPGLAFDAMGHRCGYGGGYYDKYLAAHPSHTLLALCFDFQMYAQLDVDAHDIPVDYVLSEPII